LVVIEIDRSLGALKIAELRLLNYNLIRLVARGRLRNKEDKYYENQHEEPAEGAFHEVKGKLKEVAGKLGKDYKLEAKGKAKR